MAGILDQPQTLDSVINCVSKCSPSLYWSVNGAGGSLFIIKLADCNDDEQGQGTDTDLETTEMELNVHVPYLNVPKFATWSYFKV